MKICSIEGCDSPSRRRGWCALHYSRWYHKGDPLDDSRRPIAKRDPLERFMAKVDRTDGCWIWTGYVMDNGYGQGSVSHGVKRLAHRMSYEFHVGPIPEGLVIDHLCRNRRCVNPDHLEPVTQAVNVGRGIIADVNRARAAEQTHCKQGHPFSGDNLFYRKVRGTLQRACRTCSRKAGMLSERRRRAKKKSVEVCGPSR